MSVSADDHRACFSCAQNDEEVSSDYAKCFRADAKILRSHLGGPILITKTMEESHLVHVQVENN